MAAVPSVPGTSYSAQLGQPSYSTASSEAQFVGGVCILNGTPYPFVSAEIERNAHGATDTCTVVLPVSGNPDFSVDLFRSANSNAPVYIELWAGLQSTAYAPYNTDVSNMDRRFIGVVDLYSVRFAANVVSFRCRSLGAPLADTKVTRIALNQTITSFLAEWATNFGLTPVFNLPPGYQPITVQETLGREFVGGGNFSQAIYSKRILDLCIAGALFDDAAIWVDDTTIHYESEDLIDRNSLPVVYGQDFLLEDGLEGEHAVQYSKNVEVTVKSYTARQRIVHRVKQTGDPFSGIVTKVSNSQSTTSALLGSGETLTVTNGPNGTTTSTASVTGGGASGTASETADSTSGVEKYVFYVPNKTITQCNNLAAALWRQISALEYRTVMRLPMTVNLLASLKITSLLVLSECPYTKFNGSYWPRRVRETIAPRMGWVLQIEAINHPLPQGQV